MHKSSGLFCVCVSSQIAPSSCPPTTWMRPKFSATASPSWKEEAWNVVDPPSTWRTSWVKATNSLSPRRYWSSHVWPLCLHPLERTTLMLESNISLWGLILIFSAEHFLYFFHIQSNFFLTRLLKWIICRNVLGKPIDLHLDQKCSSFFKVAQSGFVTKKKFIVCCTASFNTNSSHYVRLGIVKSIRGFVSATLDARVVCNASAWLVSDILKKLLTEINPTQIMLHQLLTQTFSQYQIFSCFLLLSEWTILLHPICQLQDLDNLDFQCFLHCFAFWLFLSGCIKHSLSVMLST